MTTQYNHFKKPDDLPDWIIEAVKIEEKPDGTRQFSFPTLDVEMQAAALKTFTEWLHATAMHRQRRFIPAVHR